MRPSPTAQHCFRGRDKPTMQGQDFFQLLPATGFSKSLDIGWLLFLSLLFITFYLSHSSPFASSSPWGWRVPLCQICSNKDVAGRPTNCLHCCAIVVPLICISESSAVGQGDRRLGEGWGGLGGSLSYCKCFEVRERRMQVRWMARSPRGQVRRRTSADENAELWFNSLAWVLDTCYNPFNPCCSLTELFFSVSCQSGLQRWVGDREAFSWALSWWQWAFCHFSDSRTGLQWNESFPELCIK